MRQTPNRYEHSAATDELLRKLFMQAKAQFGSAIKSFWFYDGNLCPACDKQIFKDARKNPCTQTAVHAAIEQNLIAAYHLHLKKLDAR